MLRSSTLGVFVGIVPGLGGTVVDWFAYGMAKQTSKNTETFGTGDVRGVIAVDAASNAKEGGALVTTIAFGVPGSVTMALLLSAFQIQGLIPGPLMLTKQVDVTLTLVWGLVLANVIGAIVCFMFVSQIAKISMINVHRIFPVLITVIYLGAFQGRQVMGDLVALLLLGLLGWAMKRGGWPRPPLILGFILGAKIEDSLWLTTERYGWDWLQDPLPASIGLMCLASIGVGIFYQPGQGRRAGSVWRLRPRWSLRPLLTAVFGIACVFFIVESRDWVYEARLFPVAIAVPTLALVAWQLAHDLFATTAPGAGVRYSDIKPTEVEDGKSLYRASAEAFGWLVGLLAVIWIAGFPAAMVLFALLYLRFRSGEKWWVAIATTVVMAGLLFLVFDGLLNVIWPDGLIAEALFD